MTSRRTRKAPRALVTKRKARRRASQIAPIVQSHSAGSIARPLRAFADETFTVLRYCQQVTFNPGSSSSSNNAFSMNGCYDPDITGVGHQPYGFDEWCAAAAAGPYNRYTVLRSRMHLVLFVPALQGATPGTADGRAGALVIINARRENSVSFTNAYSNIEDPSCQGWALVNQYQSCAKLSTPWLDVGAYFGIKPSVYGSQIDFSGTFAANPSVQGYWVVCVATPSQTVLDPIDVYATVVIEYETRFWSQDASVVSGPSPKGLEVEIEGLRKQVEELQRSTLRSSTLAALLPVQKK